MEKLVWYGTSVAIAHSVIVVLHALAHQMLLVSLSLCQSLFVGIAIVLALVLAALLLWTQFSRLGAVVLFGAMVGSLAFGLYNHFILPGPDCVFQIPMTAWGILFQGTAVLLAIVEGLGVGVSLWGLNRPQQKTVQ